MAAAGAAGALLDRVRLALIVAAALALGRVVDVRASGTEGAVDSARAITPVAASAAPAAATESFGGFRVRRVSNPNYRPASTRLPALDATRMTRLRALDHVRVSAARFGSAGVTHATRWEVAAGEQYHGEDGFEVTASGLRQGDGFRGHTLRLDARRGVWGAGAGDLAQVRLPASGTLQALRGGEIRRTLSRDARWNLFAGAPTPRPGVAGSGLRLLGLGVEGAAYDEGRWDATLYGLRQRDAELLGTASGGPVPVTRRSMALAGSARAPMPVGTLQTWWDAQQHTGPTSRALAGREAVEWSHTTPRLSIAMRDERGSRGAMVPGGDRWVPAPTSETRLNAQLRFAAGLAEAHVVGIERRGGDPILALGTRQLGVSGRLPQSPWYAGLEWSDSRRGLEPVAEHRLAAYAGFAGHRVWVMTARAEHVIRGDSRGGAGSAEVSCALPRGGQLAMEPRAGWADGRLEHAGAALRLGWALPGGFARASGLIAMGGRRDRGFHNELREASLSVSVFPRPRDRGEIEVRHVADGGAPATEWSADYEAQEQRYERFGGVRPARDSNRVVVRVTFSTNQSGVKDALVSMDGREFRYTDADGFATFERVERGTHVVAVEPGSLPQGFAVTGSTRQFVTLESGRVADPVRFEILRPAVLKRF